MKEEFTLLDSHYGCLRTKLHVSRCKPRQSTSNISFTPVNKILLKADTSKHDIIFRVKQ